MRYNVLSVDYLMKTIIVIKDKDPELPMILCEWIPFTTFKTEFSGDDLRLECDWFDTEDLKKFIRKHEYDVHISDQPE